MCSIPWKSGNLKANVSPRIENLISTISLAIHYWAMGVGISIDRCITASFLSQVFHHNSQYSYVCPRTLLQNWSLNFPHAGLNEHLKSLWAHRRVLLQRQKFHFHCTTPAISRSRKMCKAVKKKKFYFHRDDFQTWIQHYTHSKENCFVSTY